MWLLNIPVFPKVRWMLVSHAHQGTPAKHIYKTYFLSYMVYRTSKKQLCCNLRLSILFNATSALAFWMQLHTTFLKRWLVQRFPDIYIVFSLRNDKFGYGQHQSFRSLKTVTNPLWRLRTTKQWNIQTVLIIWLIRKKTRALVFTPMNFNNSIMNKNLVLHLGYWVHKLP